MRVKACFVYMRLNLWMKPVVKPRALNLTPRRLAWIFSIARNRFDERSLMLYSKTNTHEHALM